MDKAWVWLLRASLEYELGANTFVYASAKKSGNLMYIFYPCIKCRNVSYQPLGTVLDHLVIKGMDHKYKRNKCWSKHSDIRAERTTDVPTSQREAYNLIRSAFLASESNERSEGQTEDQFEVDEHGEDFEFRKNLEDVETPLYSSCPNYTKVSAIMGLYRIKVKSGMSENYFDQLLILVHDMLPDKNVLPKSTNEMKKFLTIFGFGHEIIHACKNDCVHRNEYENMVSCPRCNDSRWERNKHTGEEKKGVPAKVLRYFPIKNRFIRMFRSKRLAEELTWHFSNASTDGLMRHPVSSLTWVQVNDKWLKFAAEAKKFVVISYVRLRL